MEKMKYGMLLAVGIVAAAILAGTIRTVLKPEEENSSIRITASDGREETGESSAGKEVEEPWMTKSKIKTYQNLPDDNRDLPESNADIKFTGYDGHLLAFDWLKKDDWEQMQKLLKGYLLKKGFTDVTEVNLHPESIQRLNDYEWYVYMDVDHKNVYSDKLKIRAACDTYKGTMRFSFEIQYGS